MKMGPDAACPPRWKAFVNVVRLVLAATYALCCGCFGASLLNVSLVRGAWISGPAVFLSGVILTGAAVVGLVEFLAIFLVTFCMSDGRSNDEERNSAAVTVTV